ncbi:hypothetical protein Y032_0013g2109 [Ancylostoma ceylanicum]|uniref:Uncharacterized protein n=1 Tax=Ancylostoma ceylanicum TaxID=53326 RepID=A0A016VAT8_9BILA|nr:hypothetical protein Y032_0013g2109 [Ancylostoma ceylanicum]
MEFVLNSTVDSKAFLFLDKKGIVMGYHTDLPGLSSLSSRIQMIQLLKAIVCVQELLLHNTILMADPYRQQLDKLTIKIAKQHTNLGAIRLPPDNVGPHIARKMRKRRDS